MARHRLSGGEGLAFAVAAPNRALCRPALLVRLVPLPLALRPCRRLPRPLLGRRLHALLPADRERAVPLALPPCGEGVSPVPQPFDLGDHRPDVGDGLLPGLAALLRILCFQPRQELRRPDDPQLPELPLGHPPKLHEPLRNRRIRRRQLPTLLLGVLRPIDRLLEVDL